MWRKAWRRPANRVHAAPSLTLARIVSKAAGATTALYHLAKTITVPADSSLVITSKDTSFYLEEDRAIRALASAAGDISLMVSYEELDDA